MSCSVCRILRCEHHHSLSWMAVHGLHMEAQ